MSSLAERGEDSGSSIDIKEASREMGGGLVARGGMSRRPGGSIDCVLEIPEGFPWTELGRGESERRLRC